MLNLLSLQLSVIHIVQASNVAKVTEVAKVKNQLDSVVSILVYTYNSSIASTLAGHISRLAFIKGGGRSKFNFRSTI